MASKFSFRLTSTARNDLDDIVAYISLILSNPQAATNFLNKFQNAVNEVCCFVESGPIVDNEFLIGSNVRKKLVGNYIMYYLFNIEQKMIYVVRIVYSKRNIDDIIRNLDMQNL